VMAYSVGERTREIGTRMALGALRADVIGLIVRQSTATVATGILLGLAAAAVLTRYAEGMLFSVRPLDPATFVVVPVVFAAVALLAAYIPARRAAAVDPLVALRCD
jgi:ABC-type antimicrobial peptide transport system permease subunit